MDSRTASPPDQQLVASVADEQLYGADPMPDKISAYYSLVFPNFTYYLQTLNVTIGRRCIPSSTASSSERAQVDVDLGPLKSVSRFHAKIEYEEEQERFVLVVLGRNGAWVDGAWSGKGSKVPLGERSQIQIASRTFHFVLPPPPAPEDSPSPSSKSSPTRPRSPSVDITSVDVTSFSPPSSIPSASPPPPPPPLPAAALLPNSNAIGKAKKAGKTPKVPVASEPPALPLPPKPKPEDMPPKPPLTYAQLCYRAIKSLGGKATLQDIITWMMENYDWYRWNEKTGWEVRELKLTWVVLNLTWGQKSVRHNLSSNRAFQKMERSAGERGKGYYWSVAEDCEQMFEEQEARAAASTSGKDGKPGKKGSKAPLEPALKRSVRGEPKGALPPPLTSTPLSFKAAESGPGATVVKTEPMPAPPIPPPAANAALGPAPPPTALSSVASTSMLGSSVASASSPSAAATNSTSAIPPIPASVVLPIIVGTVPASHPSSSTASPPPIVLHENTLILNPTVFSHLTPPQLKELEALGAQKALEILHGHIVRFLKERIRTEGRVKRGKGRVGAAGGEVGRTKPEGKKRERKEKTEADVGALFTTAPLPARKPPAPKAEQLGSETVGEGGGARAPSPILVVDDVDDPPEGPVPKRRRLDVVGSQTVSAVSG
ncbi:hypothetical protein FA95DRAFT_1268135 [Auriscalpium vulgare]|uniref:Uncharacterized protein n=1 Tax=Auriscalpium vulgare TaxID=40419 RepID=A0ACB8RSZ8_9AGAM|nr:hypothetical protein FA95DRAFT_1268135 [Auriscalpium vulgare]